MCSLLLGVNNIQSYQIRIYHIKIDVIQCKIIVSVNLERSSLVYDVTPKTGAVIHLSTKIKLGTFFSNIQCSQKVRDI